MHRTLALVFLAPSLPAQQSLFPQLSPASKVQQTIGITTVGINYHRPAVRGRAVWGSLVPFGQIWRMGANEATTISFSDKVKVQGLEVPAGAYAMFAYPNKESWTIVLNKRAKQIGAWEHDPNLDLIRFDVRPKAVPHTEWLTYEIYPGGPSSAYVDLYWEKLRISFQVEVDLDRQVTTRMKQAIAKAGVKDWKALSDAAEYCVDQDYQIHQGLEWIEKSIRIQENPTNLYVKARIFHALGRQDEANAILGRALGLAYTKKAGAAVTGPMEKTKWEWKK
jgi:Protein of unknown function (DUF2911)